MQGGTRPPCWQWHVCGEHITISDGRFKVSISNEEAGGQSMFLLFDVVHLFENFFTNLLRRSTSTVQTSKGYG
ncbi:Hypothetical protein FKW44_006658 [Caligus rogercresseyi]|uniref:Uncharacterized protein n=1 Tax=Caligus rogercresseyi TaxID=217165 RepID=A0A7T8KDX2_CALRO|nr:Hypothetical protein FKW44_006658 [Caligus rogercresseyi]